MTVRTEESHDAESLIAYGVRLECVQLAAAFVPASSLAGTGNRSKEIENREGVVLVVEIPVVGEADVVAASLPRQMAA
jgi:hypothetical protein